MRLRTSMTGVPTITRKYYAEILKQFPDISKIAAARMIYKEHPSEYHDVEDARHSIRRLTGSAGKKNILTMKDETLFSPDAIARKYGIPDEIPEEYERFNLVADKVLVLNDVHIPFHSAQALALALEYGINEGCDTVLLNGDIMDCHRVSHFRHSAPVRLRFEDEVKYMRQFLAGLAKHFKQVVYKFGNHEERLEAYLEDKAPELYGLPEFELSHLLGLFDLGIKWVKDKRIIRFDHLDIIHGHEYKGGISAPVNVARGLFLRAKSIAMQGHSHATAEHTESALDGKVVTTWGVGCLCQLHPKYMPLNKWNLGFAICDRNAKGGFRVYNKRIINGEVY